MSKQSTGEMRPEYEYPEHLLEPEKVRLQREIEDIFTYLRALENRLAELRASKEIAQSQ